MRRLVGKAESRTHRPLADEKDLAPAQLALAWVRSRGERVVPIPGTKRRAYLEENLAAAEVGLTAEESERIAAALPEVAGARYDEAGMTTVHR